MVRAGCPLADFRELRISWGRIALGPRCSEWAALQWQDVDFDAGTISINRAIVVSRVDEVKTAYSGKTLPLHPMLASALCEQLNRSLWTGPGDWIFANPQSGGTKPYQPWKYAASKMKEAAIKAGLGEGIGWHTFRHSYSSMLRDLQVDVRVQQELLRHADTQFVHDLCAREQVENRLHAVAVFRREINPSKRSHVTSQELVGRHL